MLRASPFLLFVSLFLAAQMSAAADDVPASAPALTERQKEVGRLAEKFLGETRFLDGDAPLVPVGPLIRWSNPTVGEVHGETHLWTLEGRPVCIGSVYHWFTPNWGDTLEISSLVSRPLRGEQGERSFWAPAAAEIAWEECLPGEAPAGTAAGRLVQMRRLVRGVSATLGDTRQSKASVARQLRLMPQPLYRYPAPSAKASYIDGAVFAFVEGTDPELLLLIETVAHEGEPVWRSAFARVNSDAMEARWAERSSGPASGWSVEKLEFSKILSATDRPYALFSIDGASGRVKP